MAGSDDSPPAAAPSAPQDGARPPEGSTTFEVQLREATSALRDGLRQLHLLHAGQRIRGASADGTFPPAAFGGVPPVVIDANVIRNDVAYACRNDSQVTTLVNAANTGLLRLFCASHVVNEVAEHYAEWSIDVGIEATDFESVWRTQYVPLLHLVTTVPTDLLTRDEKGRIDALALKDPDDVPSATLALLIGGFYLSEDGPATAAVYGEARTRRELKKWRATLAAGSNFGAMSAIFEALALVAELARSGLSGLASTLTRAPAWVLAIAAGAGLAGALLTNSHPDASSSRRLRANLMRVLELLAAAGGAYQADLAEFTRACAPRPSTELLVRDLSSIQVLKRVVLCELAKSRHSRRSVAEITQALPVLPVAQSEGRVRYALRDQTVATQMQRGRWQLGVPVNWPLTQTALVER